MNRLLATGLGLLFLTAGPARSFVPPWLIEPGQDEASVARQSSVVPPVDTSEAVNREAFDVEHYEISLFPEFATGVIAGSVLIEVEILEEGTDFIDLDLVQELQVLQVLDETGPLTFQHDDDVLRVLAPSPLKQGDSWSPVVLYQGEPQPTGFLGFDFGTTPAGRPLLATLSQPYGARSWWPCKDTPSDKATVLLRIAAPAGFYAASNGVLEQVVPTLDGNQFIWRHDYPIPTYNVSLAVAEYVSWTETWTAPDGRQMPIEYHCFPESEEAARFDWARTTDVLDYYTELFGPYPFVDEKYGMAEFVWDGAMEHQTMTSYGNIFLTGDRFYERIIGHELAHHWWGNSMTIADWSDLWIHEGFSTLAEGLWVEQSEGVAAYRTFLRRRSNTCCGFPGPIAPPEQLFNSTVFNKAAWMLHMLRGLLGDSEFFAAVRDIAQRPELQYGSITTEDVVSQFETSTGRPLRWFFDQWLYRIGRPNFDVDFEATPQGDRTRVVIDVSQSIEDDPWTFPLTVRILTSAGNVDVETFVVGANHRITTFVDGDVTGLVADPDEWLLDFASGDATSAPSPAHTVTQLLPNYPNPFNPRTVLAFELPAPQDVTLRILDSRGRLVDEIAPGPLPAGTHRYPWTGVDARGNTVASGVYRVVLHADGTSVSTRPITLVR